MSSRINLRVGETSADYASWDKLCTESALGTYGGGARWAAVLREHFGLEQRLLLAGRGGASVGGLSLSLVRPLLGPAHAVSAPLSSSGGGLVADDEVTALALLEAASGLTRDGDLHYCQLRLVEPAPSAEALGWQLDDGYVRFILDLAGGEDVVWRQRFRDKTRNQVRKAEKAGLTIHVGREHVGELAALLHDGLKEMGSPSPSRRLLERAADVFGQDMEVVLVRHLGVAVAGSVLFFNGSDAANPWAVCRSAYRSLCANNLLYWHLVRVCCSRGCAVLDMGRSSRGSNTAAFKRHLGAEERALYYYFFLHHARAMRKVDPHQRHFAPAQFLWKKMPDILTRRLGDFLLRELM